MSERSYAPQERYDAANTVRVALKLNKKTDADLLAYLEKAPSKQGAVKKGLRLLIEAEKKGE